MCESIAPHLIRAIILLSFILTAIRIMFPVIPAIWFDYYLFVASISLMMFVECLFLDYIVIAKDDPTMTGVLCDKRNFISLLGMTSTYIFMLTIMIVYGPAVVSSLMMLLGVAPISVAIILPILCVAISTLILAVFFNSIKYRVERAKNPESNQLDKAPSNSNKDIRANSKQPQLMKSHPKATPTHREKSKKLEKSYPGSVGEEAARAMRHCVVTK